MIFISENEKPAQKRQSIDEEASSGHQQLTSDHGSSKRMKSRATYRISDLPEGHQQLTSDHGSSSKRMKSRATYRISDLPEGILQDVLSYLPAPEVVRTSILHSKWRELWTAVPCLQAENASFFEYEEDRFIDFASCMLKGRSDKAPLKVLNICCAQCEEVDYWISYAMTHRVESLQFCDVVAFNPFILDTSINFSSSYLKILVVCAVSLSATHLNQLNNHCPNLKILKLEDGHLDTFEISSSSLTSLCLRDCTTPGDLLISSRNLTLLRLINSGDGVVSLGKLPSLVEASVVLHFSIDSADDVNWIVEHFKFNILRGLSHAKSLELSVPIREPLVSWKLGGHMFSKLTTLFLDEWCMADLYPVAWFLEQAPLLENLRVALRSPSVMEYEPRIFPKERALRAACLNNATIVCVPTDPMVQELVNLLRSAAESSLMITISPDEY